MKKITLWSIVILFVVVLFSYFLIKNNNNKTPEEILKHTQSNVIENIQGNVFSNKKVDFDGYLKVDVESPFGWWNWTITYKWKWSEEKAKMDLYLTWEFNIQWQSWNIDLSSSFLVTLDKVYMKFSKISATLPDPSLQTYLAMSQMIINKWFYIENKANSKQLSKNLIDLDLQEQFKEYSIFKIDNVIEDKKYEVSLHKDNIASIVYNVSKKIEPDFNWTKQEILSNMKNIDLIWVIAIEGDSYFTFSWSMTNGLETLPFELRYLKNKLYLSMQDIVIDIDKNGDNFSGKVSLNQVWVNVNIDWKLTKETFQLNVSYNQAPIKANANLVYNAKKIDNIDIQIPENATNLQDIMQQAMGGLWLPSQEDVNSNMEDNLWE